MQLKAGTTTLENLAVSVPESVLFQALEGETVLLDVERGEYYGLNKVGSRIWILLKDGRDLSAVLRTLLDEFDVTEERLRRDIQSFLRQLRNKGLIKINDKSPA